MKLELRKSLVFVGLESKTRRRETAEQTYDGQQLYWCSVILCISPSTSPFNIYVGCNEPQL